MVIGEWWEVFCTAGTEPSSTPPYYYYTRPCVASVDYRLAIGGPRATDQRMDLESSDRNQNQATASIVRWEPCAFLWVGASVVVHLRFVLWLLLAASAAEDGGQPKGGGEGGGGQGATWKGLRDRRDWPRRSIYKKEFVMIDERKRREMTKRTKRWKGKTPFCVDSDVLLLPPWSASPDKLVIIIFYRHWGLKPLFLYLLCTYSVRTTVSLSLALSLLRPPFQLLLTLRYSTNGSTAATAHTLCVYVINCSRTMSAEPKPIDNTGTFVASHDRPVVVSAQLPSDAAPLFTAHFTSFSSLLVSYFFPPRSQAPGFFLLRRL